MTQSFPASRSHPVTGELIDQVIAHLHLAQHLPLTVTCFAQASYADPDLHHWSFERSEVLGTCDSFSEAMNLAISSVRQGGMACRSDPALRLTPWMVTILDVTHGLVRAGRVCGGRIQWCAPVASDAEARTVVMKASQLRATAQGFASSGDLRKADAVRRQAAVLEGRLVDAFWRDAVTSARVEERAA